MFHGMRKSLSVAAVFFVLAWTQAKRMGRRNSSIGGGQSYRCLEGNQHQAINQNPSTR